MTDVRKEDAMAPERMRAWREAALAGAKEVASRFAKLLDEARARREAKEGGE